MIAASAPENGVSVEWEWEAFEEPSFGEYSDDGRGACACSIVGDCVAAPGPVRSKECELDCKLPGVAVAKYLELEAEAADAEDAEAAAADDEDAMDDVTESANVVSAAHWSIHGRDAQTKGTLTNCSERCLGDVGAIQRLVRTSYYPIERI